MAVAANSCGILSVFCKPCEESVIFLCEKETIMGWGTACSPTARLSDVVTFEYSIWFLASHRNKDITALGGGGEGTEKSNPNDQGRLPLYEPAKVIGARVLV